MNTVWLRWTDADKALLSSAVKDLTVKFCDESDLTAEDFRLTDFLVGNPRLDTVKKFEKLRWLQLQSAGADPYMRPDFPSGLTLTNASGTYGLTIAEHLLAMSLMLGRKMDRYLDNQRQEIWRDEGHMQGIFGATVLVVGLGDIGTEFATRCQALGVAKVIGVKRHIYGDEAGCDEVVSSDALFEKLKEADIIASSLPSTPDTRGIFDAAAFRQMKPNAIFLNVGRGDAVKLDELCDALDAGEIAAAGLDVTDPEPLPKGHCAWQTKNLLITPHISGGYNLDATKPRFIRILTDNMTRFASGDELRNVVDFTTGYRKKA